MDAPYLTSAAAGGLPPDAPASRAGADFASGIGLGEVPFAPTTLPVSEPTPTPVPAAPLAPGAMPRPRPDAAPPPTAPPPTPSAAGPTPRAPLRH